jgi:hypothetical protein
VYPEKPSFLFLGFSAYMYRDILQPIAARLHRNEAIYPISLHDEQRARMTASLEKVAGLQSIWQHWNGEVATHAHALSKALHTAIAEIHATGALPRIIQADGQSLWPQMRNAFNWLFRFHLPIVLPQVAIAWHILERHKPALIISPDVADPRTRIYCLLGHKANIPSLEIQFGPCGPEGFEWRFLVADHIAAWGRTAHEALLTHGVTAERITVTGSPRYDSLLGVSSKEVAHTRARLGIPAENAMVLFASTYNLKEYDQLSDPELLVSMKQAVFRAADRISGLSLVVKPHPWEDLNETKKLARGSSNILFADPREDIRELTKACDAFVAFGSTATVDALVVNKLTICPAFPGWVWSDLFVKSGATLAPLSMEEVADCLQKVVDGSRDRVLTELEPARRRFLYRLMYRTDGQACARIEALARQIVRSRTGGDPIEDE